MGAFEVLLVLAVWIGASAAVLSGVANLGTGGAVVAAAAAAGLLLLHGNPVAAALLGAGGIALALWLRPPPGRPPVLLPPGSAPVLTLCVVVGALAVWIGGGIFAGPGGAPGRTAALVLIGLGTSRLVTGADAGRLPQGALLLALGIGEVAGLTAVHLSPHATVIGVCVAAVAGAALAFGGALGQRGTAIAWAVVASGLAVLAIAPSLAVIALVPLALAFAQLRAEGATQCIRSAALSAGLLGVAALAAAPAGGEKVERIAAVLAALGAAAGAGILPHLMEIDEDEVARRAFLRRAVLAPALVLAVAAQAQATLAAEPLRVFGATMLGIGALNVAAGLAAGFGASIAENGLRAWRAAYLAEWGLVFISLGLLNSAGAAASYLLLLALVLLKLPPGAWLAAADEPPRRGRARGVLLALAFAGGAPFAGFVARILLLRGATALSWPFALVIGLALAAWLPSSWRLGTALAQPRGRALQFAQVAGLLATFAIGVYPAGVLKPVGLG